MNMKNRTAALLISAVCLLSVGCASNNSSSQTDSSSEVTTSQTTAATTTPAPAPAPAPAPEPELNGSYMKNYEGISLNGQIAAIFRGKDGTVALQCNNEKRESSIYVFDAVSGKIARNIKTVNPYDKLLGVLKDGSVITQKAGEHLVYRYDEGSDTPKQIQPNFDGVAIFELDAENECIYANGKTMEDMVKISLSDSKTESYSFNGVFHLSTPISGTHLMSAVAYDERNTVPLRGVFSLDTGKKIVPLHKKSGMLYCTKDTICEVNNSEIQGTDFDVNINTYSIKEQKYLCTYSFSNESMINAQYYTDKDSDKMFVSLGKTTPMGADIEKLSVIDLTNGKMAKLDSLLNENTVTAESCTVGTRGYWLLALTDKVNNTSTTRLVLIDPAKSSYDTQLKKDTNDADENVIINCGQGLESVRAEADKLEQKYNVRILIGDEIKNLNDTNLVSTEDNPYRTAELLLDYFKTLDKQLSRYPKGFFNKFKSNGYGGMTIAIVENHEGIERSFTSAGEASNSDGQYIVSVDLDYVFNETIHHEIWHAVDFLLINKGKAIVGTQWCALNPTDFRYLNDFSKYHESTIAPTLSDVDGKTNNNDYSIPYFVENYSFVNEKEDRATVIEEIYNRAFRSDYKDPKEGYAELCKYTHIKAKIDFLAQASKEVFGYVYWEEVIKSAPLNS